MSGPSRATTLLVPGRPPVEVVLPALLGLTGDAGREVHDRGDHAGAGEEQAEAEVLTELAEEALELGPEEERQPVEEHGGGHGTADRAQAADHRDGEDRHRDIRRELRRRHRPPRVGPQHPGHGREEPRDGEDRQLHRRRAHAERRARALVVPHREEEATGARPA
jgi:hypothetical protein